MGVFSEVLHLLLILSRVSFHFRYCIFSLELQLGLFLDLSFLHLVHDFFYILSVFVRLTMATSMSLSADSPTVIFGSVPMVCLVFPLMMVYVFLPLGVAW